MATVRIAMLTIRLVMRTKVALFFTFAFPLIFLFVYAGLFAHGNPQAVLYMFGPVVTLNIMGSAFWGLGMQSVMQRERGSLRRYRLAPIGPGTIVISNLLANYLLGLPTVGLLIVCAVAVFHMPLKVSLLTLLILATVGTFAFAGFGLTIASFSNTMQEAQIYNNIAWLTLVFLSGVTIPLPLLPGWIQRLAAFLPATYLVTTFQGVMVQGDPLGAHWPEMVVLIVAGVFGLLFARKIFRWEKEERISPRSQLLALVFVIPFIVTGIGMNARGDPKASWSRTYSLLGRSTSVSSPPAETRNAILNFEEPDAAETILKNCQVTTDAAASSQLVADVSLVEPGAEETQHALRITGRLAPAPLREQASVTARCALPTLVPISGVRGIEFSVRGDSRLYRVGLAPVAPLARRASKSAQEAGTPQEYPSISFVPVSTWQTVRLPAGFLADTSHGGRPQGPWQLEMVAGGVPGEFDLEIDEIRYY
jgi:ABC-2 type transport system permease protein